MFIYDESIIVKLKDAHDLSFQEFANKLNTSNYSKHIGRKITKQNVFYWLKGTNKPDIHSVLMLCDAFNIEPNKFFRKADIRKVKQHY